MPGALRSSNSAPGFNSYREENFYCSADAGFVQRCVPLWQDDCRRLHADDADLMAQLCETHLDRNYVRIRTMISSHDILKQWHWDRDRRDYDIGWMRAEFPKFTSTGALHLPSGTPGALPLALHERMLAWYRRHRADTRPESSQPAFAYNCNTGFDNDDWVVPFSQDDDEARGLHADMERWVRARLGQWTGQDVNEHTATYGVREYHRGSVCGMHLDATETHAFSAIYNLDQRGMDEPWALDYVSHTGHEERVFMTPGDIVLYEGASTLHGRKSALRGAQFSNIFFHFRSPSWLPTIKAKLADYWRQRDAFEVAKGGGFRLTSLANAPPVQIHHRANDQCLPIRKRTQPLMPLGHWMELPGRETWDVLHARDQHHSNGVLHGAVNNLDEEAVGSARVAAMAQLDRMGKLSVVGKRGLDRMHTVPPQQSLPSVRTSWMICAILLVTLLNKLWNVSDARRCRIQHTKARLAV
jgi:hypothetical protein